MSTVTAPRPTPSASDLVWLDHARLRALDWVEVHGLPTRRAESWRYAPVSDLARLSFDLLSDSEIDLPEELDRHLPPVDGPRVVVVNGEIDRALSDLGPVAGASVGSLSDALADRPSAIRRHFEPSQIPDGYAALQIAHARDSVVITVPAGRTLDAPIHVVELVVTSGLHRAVSASVIIDLEAGSSATVVETVLGHGSEPGGSAARTTVTLGEGAALEHILVQDAPPFQQRLRRIEVVQAARSRFTARSFNLGASYGRVDYDVSLDGEEAWADLSGLYAGTDDQVLDQQVTVRHRAPGGTSRQAFRGVLDDASTGVFNGGILVAPGADGTDASQSDDNLLLSRRAEANAQPRLEILTDDIACSHGSTVGELDDDAIYYLRTRGFDADRARRTLVGAFASQVVDQLASRDLRAWIGSRLALEHE